MCVCLYIYLCVYIFVQFSAFQFMTLTLENGASLRGAQNMPDVAETCTENCRLTMLQGQEIGAK